jgi:perosamine synthetase
MRIPLSAPDITEEEIRAVADVLRTPSLSLGPKLKEFEETLARYIGVSHAVAVSSGTAALHLCVRALGISDGDEVIMPSFTFIAVANAVRYERATPVFVDIEERTFNLDPDLIEAAITPRTRAIIVVHTFGVPADLDRIIQIARKHRLLVIEDACEAIGAEYRGSKVGTFGDVAVFAFFPNKQITTGEGGAVVTNNAEIADKIRKLRNQGKDDSGAWLQHSEVGYNYRLSEISCALGIEQLKRIDCILDRRADAARRYDDQLSDVSEVIPPKLEFSDRKVSWFVYVVRLDARFDQPSRDWIYSEMQSRGIGLGRYFGPIHLQPIYRTFLRGAPALRVTESVAKRSLALPFFNRIEGSQIQEVCRHLSSTVTSVSQSVQDKSFSGENDTC